MQLKNFICTIFLLVHSYSIYAQAPRKYGFERKEKKSIYAEDASLELKRSDKLKKFLNFGMFFGPTFSRMNVGLTNDFIQGDPNQFNGLVAISPRSSAGIMIGAYSNFRLNDFFDFRFCVNGFAGYEFGLDYIYQNGTTKSKLVEASMLELPILIKYRSQLRGTRGLYLVAGIKPSFLLTNRKNDDENVTVNTRDIAIDYGFGLEKFYSYFKFAPEIRFSHGLMNMLNKQELNQFNRPLQSVSFHTVTLYLHFGG
jgi:hypothetical protein